MTASSRALATVLFTDIVGSTERATELGDRHWQRLLDEGTCSTIKDIAAKENIDPSYVGDVLRLTLLAPDIVEMILDGRQPPALQFETLRKSLPLLWEEQRKAIRDSKRNGAG